MNDSKQNHLFGNILLISKNFFPVLIPLGLYLLYQNLLAAVIGCIVWRAACFAGDYIELKNPIISFLSIMILGLSFALTNNAATIVCLFISLLLFYLTQPFHIEKYDNLATKSLSIFGMVISSILIAFIGIKLVLAIIYVINYAQIMLFQKTKFKKSAYIAIASTSKRDMSIYIIAFFHNAHYYLYSVLLPIVLLEKGVPIPYIGICFALGWVYYLFKKELAIIINNKLQISLEKQIIIGFFATSIVLFLIAHYGSIPVILVGWLLSGITAGIAESFWMLPCINSDTRVCGLIWKIGGLFGAICSIIICAPWGGFDLIFWVAGFICLVASITFFVYYILKRVGGK